MRSEKRKGLLFSLGVCIALLGVFVFLGGFVALAQGESGEENFALGRPVKASSSQTDQYQPGPVTDGKIEVGPQKMWVSGGVSPGSPQWLVIDLGEKRTFNSITLWNSGNAKNGLQFSAKKGKIEGSNLAAAWLRPERDAYWTTIADFAFPNIARAPLTSEFSPVCYRYVRLLITEGWVPNENVQVTEWRIAFNPELLFAVITERPGNVFPETMATVFQVKYPLQGQTWDWRVVDWLGQECLQGKWQVEKELVLPDLPLGYYRLQVKGVGDSAWQKTIPFARVIDPAKRRIDPDSPYVMDSAQSWLASPGYAGNSLQPPDAYRVISDLEYLAGFPMVRERMSWGEVNPRPDEYNWGRYMTNARLLAERGIKVLGMFHDAPGWTKEGLKSLPSNLMALYRFTQTAAKEFKGIMPAWEFWNEEDIGFCQDTAWDFAAAQKAAYLGFKAGDPQVNVLIGSTCVHPVPRFMDVVLQNGVGDYFDTFNFHNYGRLEEFPTIIADERDFLKRHGVGDKPMWVTENGLAYEGHGRMESLAPGSGLAEHDDEQERLQAEYLVKAQIVSQALGVERSFSFVFPPYTEQGGGKVWGILRQDYLVKPAYAALANLTAQLGNTRYLGRFKVAEGVEGYLYEEKDSREQILVCWSEGEGSRSFTLTNQAPRLEIVDLVGKADTLMPVEGKFSLKVTKYPLYLRGLRNLEPTSPALVPEKPAAVGTERDLTIVLRIRLGENFKILNKSTATLSNGKEGLATLDIFNFSAQEKRGRVESLGDGYDIEGLPPSVTVPAMGKISLPLKIKITDSGKKNIDLKIGGTFDSKPISPLYVPVLPNVDLSGNPNLEAKELPITDVARWRTNSSGKMEIAYDAQEKAIRFQVQFPPNVDRWVYPEFPLLLPAESLAGAVGISFEIKAEKVLNGFNHTLLMAVTEDIHEKGQAYHLNYAPPTTSWQTVAVLFEIEAPPDFNPAEVKMLRLGANPNQDDYIYWVRNLKVYYPKTQK